MSSTTTTQYYGLTQYIGTDKPDWTDNNEAFREVDADLHEAVQSMEGFGTDISALQEARNALTTEVRGLEADLNTEKAKIRALQNKETLQDAEIAGVRADALDMITAVDEGTAQVATVAVNEGKYFRYNDVLYMATTNIAVGDTIVPNTNCRATNVGTELEAQAEDIAEVKSELGDISNYIEKNCKAEAIGTFDISVDGTNKTYKECIRSLFASVDVSKINGGSKILLITDNSTYSVLHFGQRINNAFKFGTTYGIGVEPNLYTLFVNNGTNDATYTRVTYNNDTWNLTDFSDTTFGGILALVY